MNTSTLLLLAVFLYTLLSTGNIFWLTIAGLLFAAYLLVITSRVAGKGIKRTHAKISQVYAGEMKELESVTGKYPAKFFDAVGKGAMEKINEYQAPKGAKSSKDTFNYKWEIKNPAEKISESAQKIMDSLGKLFSK